MAHTDQEGLHLEIQVLRPTACSATVVIPATLVDTIYHQASLSQQQLIHAHGFARGSVPLEYIQLNFKSSLLEHVKEFLFNYFVISFLYKELRTKKILYSGEPRLTDINIEPHSDARFSFELNTFPAIEIHEWKYLPFKAPKRKKYKDLDRQVESFIKDEKDRQKNKVDHIIEIGDWVNFDISLVDFESNRLLKEHVQDAWCKIGDEEADAPLREMFLGKKTGETFCTNNKDIQTFFSTQMNTNYNFRITIADVVSDAFFCLELFKRHFKLKTNKEMYQKLIEVFSYRNDLSQRRSMAEEALKLLLTKHRILVPTHLVLRQQNTILDAIQSSPDYHVYRMQKDFKKRVRQLAEKQVREQLLLDQLAYHENINVNNEDIQQYLNLIKRPRTKEFIYFDSPIIKLRGQETPIPTEELKQACLREKTLNHIIYHLTKD